MNTHTPGPWKTERRTFNYGCYGHEISTTEHSQRVLVTPRRSSIAVIHSDDDEDRANARLISLAPELLSALEELLEQNQLLRDARLTGQKSKIESRVGALAYAESQTRALLARAKGGAL